MIFDDIIYDERGVKSGIFAENKPKLLQMFQRSNLEIGYLDVFDITINKIVNEYYNDL